MCRNSKWVLQMAAGISCCFILSGMASADPVKTDLKAWYSAETLAKALNDGDIVSEWGDLSGLGNDLAGGDPYKPTFKTGILNGKPVVRLIDGARQMVSPDWGKGEDAEFAVTEFTVFVVVANWASGGPLSLGQAHEADFGNIPALTYKNGKPMVVHQSSTGNYSYLEHQTDVPTTDGVIIEVLYGTTPSDLNLFVNGVRSTQSVQVTGTPQNFQAVNRGIVLGADRLGDWHWFQGDIAEVLIYTRNLTDAERAQTEKYLAQKYSLKVIHEPVASLTIERPEIMFGRKDENAQSVETSQGQLPIDSWEPPKQVNFERVGGDIIVYLNTSSQIFSGRTVNISGAKVLGTSIVETSHPNLVAVSPDGTEYTQNLSTKGKIDAFDDGEYINIFGRFTLTSETSKTFITPDVWYKIDKNNGYTQVRYTLYGNIEEVKPPIEIKKLYVDTIVGNVKYNKVEHFWQGCGIMRNDESVWDGWTNFKADISQDKVIVSDKIVNMMMVSNARMGFATEPITFDGISVDKGLDGYQSYLAKNNEHIFRYTFINRRSESHKLILPYNIQFTMSYAPFREYRKPKMHFFAGAQVPISECARVGVDIHETWGYMGYPYDSQTHYDERVTFNKKAHKYNIKHTHFCVNWYPLAGPNPRYPEPYRETAKYDQLFDFGRFFTWSSNPDNPFMCLNSKGWFENYYLNAVHNIVDLDGDGLRVDCNTPNICRNTEHGCSKDYSLETLSYYNFGKEVDRFFKSRSKETGREYILASSTNIQPCNHAYLDFTLTGEGEMGYPSEAARDAVYTAFLYGRDFNKLAGGNSPASFDTSKIFEMMIARCGVPMYLFSSDGFQAAMWMKYTNPFRIFNVNNSEVHHPYHYDYPKYTRNLADKVFPIVYSRKNEAFIAVCNESGQEGNGDLVLHVNALGLPGEVMVFEPFSGTYNLAKSKDEDIINIPVTFPAPWDVDFYIVRSVPQNPEVIWHDVRVWEVNQSWDKGVLSVQIKGIPETTYSYMDIFTASMGCPVGIEGASLLSYNPADGMAKIKVVHNDSSVNVFSMKFDKHRARAPKVDVLVSYEQIKKIMTMIKGMNYYKKDKDALQGKINSIRENGDAIPLDKRREILTYLTDVERFLYSYDEVKSYDKVVADFIDRIRSNNYREQEWTVLGPFANDQKSDFGYESNILPANLDFSATYKGLDGNVVTGKNTIGYYLDFNTLTKVPVVGAGGENLRNMTAFASSMIVSNKDRSATLNLSGIGRVKVWLNGNLLSIENAQKIMEAKPGGLKPDPFKASCNVEFKNGENIIVYKLECGPENWEVFTTFSDSNGKDITTEITFQPIVNMDKKEYAHPFYLNAKEVL